MNAHQKYVANVVTGLNPAQVAELVANPPTGRSTALGVKDIHEMVTTYGVDATKVAWAALLAAAAGVKPGSEWPATWSLPIGLMIFELPAPDAEQGLEVAA